MKTSYFEIVDDGYTTLHDHKIMANNNYNIPRKICTMFWYALFWFNSVIRFSRLILWYNHPSASEVLTVNDTSKISCA